MANGGTSATLPQMLQDRMQQYMAGSYSQPAAGTAPAPIPAGGGMYGLPNQYTYTADSTRTFVNAPTTGKDRARETRAMLARAEFEDYKKRFLPVELRAINEMTTDFGTLTNQELDRSAYAINNAYKAGLGMQSRRLARYGLSAPTDNSAMNRSNVSTLVGGLNYATQNAEDRRNAFIGGGMSSLAEVKKDEEG